MCVGGMKGIYYSVQANFTASDLNPNPNANTIPANSFKKARVLELILYTHTRSCEWTVRHPGLACA